MDIQMKCCFVDTENIFLQLDITIANDYAA